MLDSRSRLISSYLSRYCELIIVPGKRYKFYITKNCYNITENNRVKRETNSRIKKMTEINIGIVSVIVFLINLPFGYWRAQTRRFSLRWLIAVHLPIIFVIVSRIFGGIGWQLATFPILIGTYFAGQFLGGILYNHLKKI